MVEPKYRLTIGQKVGGTIYDFVNAYDVHLSDGQETQLLSFIRNETHMADPTLQKVFCGKTNSFAHYNRVLCAIQKWVTKKDYNCLCERLASTTYLFFDDQGDVFLEEQRTRNRPKRKNKPNP